MEQQNQQNPITPTPAEAWVGAVQIEGTDLALPSGNVARVKQIAPQALLASGMIPNPLMSIIRKAINDNRGLPPAAVKKIAEDDKLLVSALELFDRVLTECLVAPECQMPPTCAECDEYANKPQHDPGVRGFHKYQEKPRTPGILYADVVNMDDKTFIFQWVLGGTRDLEKFRGELAASVGDLSDGEDVQHDAEQVVVDQ